MNVYQICISGASKGESVEEGKELAYKAGRAVGKSGHMLITGATTGLPDFAAKGAHEAGGVSVGISPASSKLEHVKKYRLPINYYDVVFYTGLHYVGRDTFLITSCDAVISVGGRLGTLHEFTIAMELEKPIGLLMGGGGISTEIKDVLRAAGRREDKDMLFDDNPARLVKRIVALLDADDAVIPNRKK